MGYLHGLIKYIDTKGKCRHLKKLTCCSAQTRTGIGLLEKPPAVKQFLAVESHLGVRASYATRRKRRYEANKCC
jgi:hypothetical protein